MLAAAPPPSQDSTAGLIGLGVVLVIVGVVILFITQGGPAATAQRWAAFKNWFWRKFAFVLMFGGAFLIIDTWIRS